MTDDHLRSTPAHLAPAPRRSVRRLGLAASLTAAALGGSLLVASPSSAAPDVDDVQTKVDRLDRRADQASQRLDAADVTSRQARKHVDAVRKSLRKERTKIAAMRRQVAESAITSAQDQAIDSASQLVLSDAVDASGRQETAAAELNGQQRELLSGSTLRAQRLETRERLARRELVKATKGQKQQRAVKARADERASEAQELLGTLQDRADARASRSSDRTAGASAPASGRAAAAVQYALAQVGKAYVFGAAGPSAFDCSGLTMAAWGQAGVGLPHSSGAQMGSGRPVSQSELQPGDLVFYYSPVSHVAIYIGNGNVVGAQNPSTGVKIVGVNSMPYAGAVRPG